MTRTEGQASGAVKRHRNHEPMEPNAALGRISLVPTHTSRFALPLTAVVAIVALFSLGVATRALAKSSLAAKVSSDAVALPAPAPRPFALVELFTSEGCSSCPPADENLARITREAELSGARIFTLELHVDYWNMLGWEDPFSSVVHSDRQSAYGKKRGTRGVYTPQVLINGHREVVGSRAVESRAAISESLKEPAALGVAVGAARDPQGMRVDYRVQAHAAALDLNLAVAQGAVETRVTRGENAAKVLRHRHVVRAFHTLRLPPSERATSGSVVLPWPEDAKGRSFVAGYAVDPSSLRVLGADGHDLD